MKIINQMKANMVEKPKKMVDESNYIPGIVGVTVSRRVQCGIIESHTLNTLNTKIEMAGNRITDIENGQHSIKSQI
jgi:hypothetical protein